MYYIICCLNILYYTMIPHVSKYNMILFIAMSSCHQPPSCLYSFTYEYKAYKISFNIIVCITYE